jgi:hypothetical protein
MNTGWVSSNADVERDASRSAMENALTQKGVSLAELSRVAPVLLIFLRHFG